MSDRASQLATLSNEALVRRYVDGSFRWLEHVGMNVWPGTPPPEMWAGERNADGWRPWRLVPSTVTDSELNALQAEHGLPYQPVYRAFLKCAHFVDLAAFGLDFERHLPGEWAGALRHLYFESFYPERIIRSGLLPFGSERLSDAGLVCFDTNHRGQADDSPVVIWDHEWVDTDKEVVPLYSSARKLFESQAFYVESDINFDGWEEAPEHAHRRLVDEFLTVDARGLGSYGRRWIASFYPRLVQASA
jgi:hypothetical protein